MIVDITTDSPPHEQLCRDYWENIEGEFLLSVSALSSKYCLSSCDILKVVRNFSNAVSVDVICSACGVPYDFSSRTDYLKNKSRHDWVCSECIQSQQMSNEEEKFILLNNALKSSLDNSVGLGDLSVKQAVFLLTIMRLTANEDLTGLTEFGSVTSEKMSPSSDYDYVIIKTLYRNNLMSIDPISDLDSINLKERNKFVFSMDRVRWVVTIKDHSPYFGCFMQQLQDKISSMEYLESSHEDIICLSKEIALEECLAYLHYCLGEHGLPCKSGEKTHLVLGKALESFSVSQIYSFIWGASKDAAAYYQRSTVPRAQAANTVVSNIEKRSERAVIENWNVKPFQRNYNLPQSEVSRTLYNSLLHTSDGGFSQLLKSIV